MINIRTRLTYQFVLLVTLILILFSVGVYFFSQLYLEKRFYKRLQDRAITTTTLLFDLQQSDSTIIRLIQAANREPLFDENISVYRAGSRELLFSSNHANARLHEQLLSGLDTSGQAHYLRQNEYRVLILNLPKGRDRLWVVVSGIDQAGQEALSDLRRILLIMILAAILLIGVSGWFFADRALAPISRIIRQVKDIFPLHLSRRVEHPNQTDEIGLLVATFNQLLARIEQALHAQKIFIANVSHELKNPLTKISSQIDVALIQPRSPEAYTRALRSLQEDSRSLTQLTNTLLELANTAIDAGQLSFEAVRMDELLYEAKAQLLEWHAGYRVPLTFPDFPDDEDALIVYGNRASLKVLLMNLLDNACKFSADGTATVDFRSAGGAITIRIFNTGTPIPEADLPYIFQPFFRSNATASSRKGHGVGLAVVQQIAQLHKGTVGVQSTAEGTTFTLDLASKAAF